MWRVLIFLGLLCLAAYGAVWLAGNPETISVTWAGREYTTSLAVGVVGLVAVAILVTLVIGLIRGAIMLPVAIGRGARRRKLRKGQAALTRGIVAVGAGDVAAARRYAGEAERLLGREPLALLLKAQAAQASGQRDRAEAAFREMAAVPETRVLGLRGLYVEARRRGDAEDARHHAEEAARAAPAAEWASDAVLDGLSSDGDWAGAIRMIERRTSLGLVDRATSRRQRAVLYAADALDRETNDPAGALSAAEQAVKLAPDLVPAAALAARLLSAQGDVKRAAKIVEAAWSQNPHPDLAGAYLNLRSGDSAGDRLRRAETLARLSSWSDEARFAIARAAIETRDLPRARDTLQPLLDGGDRPTVRLCMAMAEIEGRSGNAGGAREWLARAARAPRDRAWIADGVVTDRWAPVSPVTGRLDAFAWETPPDMLGAPIETDIGAFEPEPEPEAELPAFLGRDLPRPGRPAETPEPPALPPRSDEQAGAADEVADAAPSKPSLAAVKPEPAPPEASVTKPAPSTPVVAAHPLVAPTIVASPIVAPSVPEPVATEPPRLAGPNGGRPGASRASAAEPEPVVFPVRHPPDDPGLEDKDRRQRFRLRV